MQNLFFVTINFFFFESEEAGEMFSHQLVSVLYFFLACNFKISPYEETAGLKAPWNLQWFHTIEADKLQQWWVKFWNQAN
jgi:hypothetical protein